MYAFLIISLLGLSTLEYSNLLRSRRFILLSVFSLMVLSTGLRGFTGTDTYNYFIIYNNIESYKDILEFGFYYTTVILKFVSNNDFTLYLILMASISLLFYFVALSQARTKTISNPSVCSNFCDLYLYFNFSGMRQGMSLSIILLGYYFLIYRRPILYFLVFYCHKFS